ncbi:complex I intermediate-associated protein 30-domain-containing protein [Myxozyma melibiosi]|uniref:Complex I intermediate-associated protein 30-domain-containing protein n=1 Tax=Myxozyma melibiosi TaxID=54550 RepID=A0ABR1FCF7_9ASCO
MVTTEGFLARSLRALKVLVKSSTTAQMTRQEVFDLIKFDSPESISKCLTRSDQELGGYSTVNLDWDEKEKCAHFHGNLSLDLPPSRPEVTRSGYAMFRTKDRPRNFKDDVIYWNLSDATHIAMRVKGDRRKYFVNLQSKTALPTEIHQHRLFLYDPGNWEIAVIPFKNFLLTHWGRVEQHQQIDQAKVKTVGIGLLDRRYGPFSLKVGWIKAITDDEAMKYLQERRVRYENWKRNNPAAAAESEKKLSEFEERKRKDPNPMEL